MATLFSRINTSDPKAFIETAKSYPQEERDKWGVIENSVLRVADGSGFMLVSTYKTLEEAQKHKAYIEESPDVEALMKRMGVQLPTDIWIAEQA
ncbi:MAG: hypothetical protein K8L99_10880 [Anaerolineae bacterium]|nr:hypothetical protein [Anaerolineae bacterium]